MQKSRRWRGLQLDVLSVAAATLLCGCASSPPPPPPTPEPQPPTSDAQQGSDAPPPPAVASAAAPEPAAPAGAPSNDTAAALPQGSRILQVGDSFADALGVELGKLLRAAGLRTSLETKTPSYIGDWAFGPQLKKAISDYNPDLVLITLGANEIEIPAPEQRVGPVQRLVKSLGGRPCVWILPPLWKQDTGVMQVIKDNAKPCQVLDSSTLVPDLPRGRDHIHPSTEGRVRWATAVFDWLQQAREPAGPRPWSLRGGPL